MDAAWAEEKVKPSPSLWRAIYRAHKAEFWTAGMWTILEHVAMLSQPILLTAYLQYLTSSAPSLPLGLGLGFSLLFVSWLQAVFHHQTYYTTMRAGWNLRITFTLMVHAKLLRLSVPSAGSSAGLCLNLVSSDVFRFDAFMPALWHYVSGPLDLLVVLTLLSAEVRFLPALMGVCVVLADVALKLCLGRRIGAIRARTAGRTDARVRATKELLTGAETVKVRSVCVWGVSRFFARWRRGRRKKGGG